jgi:hypothetical protein
MLDDLRNSAVQSIPDEEVEAEVQPQGQVTLRPGKKRKKKQKFLGMTAAQRFILSLMLLFITCLGGSLCLLLTGRVVLF